MAGTPIIRRAELADRDVIADYNVSMAKETEDLELQLRTVQPGVGAIISDLSKGTYYVAEVDGKVVAQLMITYEWSDWRNSQMWWIQSVYVHPNHRKQGLFRKLYEHVRGEAKSAGAGGLRLYVDKTNTKAQATYAALGMISHYAMFEEEFTAIGNE